MGRAVVIGAGITGTLTALALVESGWEVTLLEGASVGAGSSSRSAAGIRQQFSTPESVRAMRYSVNYYRQFAERIPGGLSPIEQSGYLFLYDEARRWSEAKQRAEMQRSVGLTEVCTLESTALLERFPWVSPEILGGTFCPTDGFLRPSVVFHEAAELFVSLGGTLLQRAPVIAADHAGGRLIAVSTTKGTYEADLFFDCTNAWSVRLAQILQAQVLPIQPLKRYLWFLQRGGSMTAEVLGRMPMVVTPSGGYCRPENPNVLMMGRKHAVEPSGAFTYEEQDTIEPDFSHRGGIDAVPYALWADLAEAIPLLEEFDGLRATTSGFYASTPDHNPFLGFDGAIDGLIRLVGFSGHGAMMAPFAAWVAQQLAGAGNSLEQLVLDGAALELNSFSLNRRYNHAEQLVI